MTARTEQKLAVIAERLVLHIGGNGIGARFLLREADVVIHAVLSGISGSFLVYQCLEQRTVLGRYGEVHVYLTTLVGSIKRTFHQMFFERGTAAVLVFMKLQQSFRKRAVIQSCRFEQGGNHRLVIAGGNQGGNILAGCFQASGIQVVIESELPDFPEECFLKVRLRSIVFRSEEFK